MKKNRGFVDSEFVKIEQVKYILPNVSNSNYVSYHQQLNDGRDAPHRHIYDEIAKFSKLRFSNRHQVIRPN
jgi:hypothetical protein